MGLTAVDEMYECIEPDETGRSRAPLFEQWLGEIDNYSDAIDKMRE